MEAELKRLRNYVSDMQRGIIKDVKVICLDGSTTLSSTIVSNRSPVLKCMFDGTFKESATKTVEFPENSVTIVNSVLDFIHYATLPDFTIMKSDKMFDMLDFAYRYEINELVEYLTESLINDALKNSDYALDIYVISRLDSRYDQIKDVAFSTIKKCLKGNHIIFWCDECGAIIDKIICDFSKCDRLINKDDTEKMKCIYGHVNENMYCEDVTGNSCEGKIYKKFDRLYLDDTCDEIVAEIMRKYVQS